MDWQALGTRLAPVLAVVFGLSAILSIFVVYRARRTARATTFGFVREQSITRAKQFLIFAVLFVLFLGASASLWAVSLRHPELLPTRAPTATPTLIPSPTPRPPTATWTVTLTPTVTPTPTQTPTPPESDLPSVLREPLPPQAVTPGPDAALVEVVLAAGQKDDKPVNPTTRFPPGTQYVYIFVTLNGMARNVPWAHVWYKEVDGQMVELWGRVELWSYDATRGYTWRYFECDPGRYELHVYVGRRLEQKIPFTVDQE